MTSERSKWMKFLGALFCIAVVLTFASMGAKAQESNANDVDSAREYYDQLKAQAADLDKQIAALDKDITAGKNTVAAKQQQVEANRQKAVVIEKQIEVKQQEIDLQLGAITQKQSDIETTQGEYDDSFALYTQRLVAIYKMNNAGVASTLLNVTSYSELLGVSNALQTVARHDTQLLEDITATKTQLEQQKLDLEILLAGLEEAREDMNADLAELERLNGILGQQISDGMQQVLQTQEEQRELQREREAMQAEIDNVFASLPKNEEEFYGGDLAWPVPGHEGSAFITSPFGWRTLGNITEFHTGIDIARGSQSYIQGKDIVAALDGTVAFVSTSNPSGGYGYYLIVDHGGGIRTLYAHCDSISVSVGDSVTQGTTIATVGNTGRSTGPHLHFELRLNNTEKVDPYPYLTGQSKLY